MHGRQTYTKEEEEEEKGSPGFNERTRRARRDCQRSLLRLLMSLFCLASVALHTSPHLSSREEERK